MALVSEKRVLLPRRFQTGYEDGKCSLIAGHVEADEIVTQAAIREAEEEEGILVPEPALKVRHVMDRCEVYNVRISFFLVAETWTGDPVNMEPHKCDAMGWFAKDTLPLNTVPYIRPGLDATAIGLPYGEVGWTPPTGVFPRGLLNFFNRTREWQPI